MEATAYNGISTSIRETKETPLPLGPLPLWLEGEAVCQGGTYTDPLMP